MKLVVSDISYPTQDSVSLRFIKIKALETYRPGQHALLNFSIDGQNFKRTYSLHTVSELDNDAAITVRTVKDGKVSNFLRNASPSEINVELEGVAGDFQVEPSEHGKRHLIMFAGGSGITPIFSMTRAILVREPQSSISLIYANQSYERIIFRDELAQLEKQYADRFKVHHILSKADSAPEDFNIFYRGRLSKLIAKRTIKDILSIVPFGVEFYLCGPMEFMSVSKEAIKALNLNNCQIHQEHFYIPDAGKDSFDFNTVPPRQISLSWKDVDNSFIVQSGESILQAALRNNLRVPHACTEGQCGTCRSLLASGEIKLRRNHILTEEELKAGQILLCQGFPMSDNVAIKVNDSRKEQIIL